ncbi:MAG: BlaI/MecI/CopY family transcriptional regulator [Acutalibacteraceae bacterium]
MEELHMGAIESKFADIIWSNEPVATTQLTKLCEKQLGWKRTTTYTVLKRLCERGIFKTENSIVTSLISRPDYYSMRSESVVEESFNGSLPAFIAAFTARKKLSDSDISEIQRMIDSYRRGE